MEVAAISALVGAVVSFVVEAVPEVKDWLATLPDLAVRGIFAGVFLLVPLAVSFAACQGFTIPGIAATCPAVANDYWVIVMNSVIAFMSSQVWHAYVGKKLVSAG